jgi:hypothetical protein
VLYATDIHRQRLQSDVQRDSESGFSDLKDYLGTPPSFLANRARTVRCDTWVTNDQETKHALVLHPSAFRCPADDWISRTRGPRVRVGSDFRFHISCRVRCPSYDSYHIFRPSPAARRHSDRLESLGPFRGLVGTSAPAQGVGAP